jgi:hypothetical protein
MTPALRDLFTAMAETTDVPAPARSDGERAYLRLMESRLADLGVVLRHMATDGADFTAGQIRGQASLLRQWAEKHPVTYEPWVPLSARQEKSS